MSGWAKLSWLLAAAALLAAGPLAADVEDEERRLAGLALDLMLESQLRIMRVADPIRVAGAPFCGNEVGPVLGAYAADRYSLSDLMGDEAVVEPFIDAAVARLELAKSPRVLAVLPGSPADLDGLRPGDLLQEIAGRKPRKRVLLDALSGKDHAGALRLEVERGEALEEVVVRAPPGCAFASRFLFGDGVNAFAARFGDLTGMYVTAGMLRFAPSDDDLAVVLGHELAHLILKHVTVRRAASRRYEQEADYVGLYLAARAGFDVSGAPEVWDRMSRLSPYSTIDWGAYTHPTSPTRALALRQTLAEIAGKRERGEPLEPDWR